MQQAGFEGPIFFICPSARSGSMRRNSWAFRRYLLLVVFSIFLFFVYQVFKKLYVEDNNQTKLILVGSMSIILLQAFIHIGVNIRLLPTTGMTLPFISYGGSSIVSTSILSGIILNLTKRRVN